jgi:hypothetical protein
VDFRAAGHLLRLLPGKFQPEHDLPLAPELLRQLGDLEVFPAVFLEEPAHGNKIAPRLKILSTKAAKDTKVTMEKKS